jgi:hypothetical protein
LLPTDATKKTHEAERNAIKAHVCWACSTAWVNTRWRGGSASRRSLPAN